MTKDKEPVATMTQGRSGQSGSVRNRDERIGVCRAAVQADITELRNAIKAADRPRKTRSSASPRQGRVWKAIDALQVSSRALIDTQKECVP